MGDGEEGREAIDLAFKLQTKRKRKEEKVSGRRRRMGEKEGVEAELKNIVGEWGHGTLVLIIPKRSLNPIKKCNFSLFFKK